MNLFAIWPLLVSYGLWVESLVIIGVGVIVYGAIRLAGHRIQDPKTRVTLSRVAGTVLTLIVLVLLGSIWVNYGAEVVLLLGLIGAGLSFSLQGPITSLIGWGIVVFLRPFAVGDRVQIGQVSGDVVGFNLFYFSLLEIDGWSLVNQYTGRQVEVPNNLLLSQTLWNYSRNFRFLWDNVTVGVYYGADWEKARKIILEEADKLSRPLVPAAKHQLERFGRAYYLRSPQLGAQVFVSLASTTINLSVRYICDIWDRSQTRTHLVEQILKGLKQAGISIAYPSVVLRSPSDEEPAGPPGPSSQFLVPPGAKLPPSADARS